MTLQDRLTEDLKAAMRSGDKSRIATLRMIKAAVKNAEIAKGKPLDDADVIEVLNKEAKKHRESISEFTRADRRGAVEKEEEGLAIVLEYLPEQMTREEVENAARAVIEEVGARGPKDKGKVMSALMPRVKGKAEGQMVNQVVSNLLESI
ncbi:MAG: GatB/YqeY domain-containing protein [Dehalococcoidia bacterium]